ncbi:hypothetical protein SUBVAR_05945 [Subdoligranulum variabile DSM 15176]|uniref:Uncharacterized protein n=1 Tax=Subdoligranulum variabile DSM 15176 TaxID=411471 RepID=D1PNM4_9FIRM|nr:hypothetical protein SUBVAR_05945 [Subdoligranulum variabile DSM 15176]
MIHRYTGLGLLGVSMTTTSLFRYIVIADLHTRPYFTTWAQVSSTPKQTFFHKKRFTPEFGVNLCQICIADAAARYFFT